MAIFTYMLEYLSLGVTKTFLKECLIKMLICVLSLCLGSEVTYTKFKINAFYFHRRNL